MGGGGDSVSVLVAEFGTHPHQEVHVLEGIDPVPHGGGGFVGGYFRARQGARWSKALGREEPESVESFVRGKEAELKFFVEKEDGGDAIAAADHDLFGEVLVFVAIDEAKVDGPGVGLCDVVEHGDLLGAVAAPHAGGDEDAEGAGEGLDERALGVG